MRVEEINAAIAELKVVSGNENDVSDGFHTFGELYEFRKVYNALLFNVWAASWMESKKWMRSYLGTTELPKTNPRYDVHKSMRHYDGELCFGGGWFIVCAMLPNGLVTNHYKIEDWDLFKIPAVDKAKYEFDGHMAADVLERLKLIL